MSFEVVVLGSANLDLVLAVDRYPGAGETVVATGHRESPGGKGLNQAVAAARAGARTTFVAAVGDDEAGRSLLGTLGDEHVDTSATDVVAGPTGRAVVVVQPSGENTIVVVPGANASLTLGRHARSLVAGGSVVVAQLEVPVPVVEDAFRSARAAGVTTVLNAAPAVPLTDGLLDTVDVLVVNEHEAMLLGGGTDPVAAATRLSSRVERTVVTLGPDGAVLVAATGVLRTVPGIPAQAVDTTGAGDTFVGNLAAGLAGRLPLPEAVGRAVAAGSLAVERPGAALAAPTRAETDERLAARGGG